MRSFFRSLYTGCLLVTVLVSQSMADADSERVLHRKVLSGGRELVVVQSPMVPVQLVADMLSKKRADEAVRMYSLNLEIRSPEGLSLRLWSRPYPCPTKSDYEKCQVLDLAIMPNVLMLPDRAVIPDRVVMVIATHTGSISVQEQGLLGPWRTATLRPADWSQTEVTSSNLPHAAGGRSSSTMRRKIAWKSRSQITLSRPNCIPSSSRNLTPRLT